MGKHAKMNHDDLVSQAQDIAVRAGRLTRCEIHEIVSEGHEGLETRAYAFVTTAWKKGEIAVEREELMDAMKEAIKKAPPRCYLCDHHRGKND